MGLEVSTKLVRTVMRKELGMGYRMAKKVPVQSNLERNLVLRQQYSLQILPILEQVYTSENLRPGSISEEIIS